MNDPTPVPPHFLLEGLLGKTPLGPRRWRPGQTVNLQRDAGTPAPPVVTPPHPVSGHRAQARLSSEWAGGCRLLVFRLYLNLAFWDLPSLPLFTFVSRGFGVFSEICL